MGFRSYIRQFLGVILYFSVLQCHGDLLLGVVRFLASQPATGVAGAGVVAAAGGKRRKQEEKAAKITSLFSFSMGFRSYIRQFLGAILMLFRPSLPWGFAAGSGSIFGVAACHRSSRSRSSSSRKQEEKVATIIFSMGFRKVAGSMGFRSYIRQFLGAILMLFRPSLPWGFAAVNGWTIGAAACHRSSRIRSSSSRKQEKVATIIFSIYRFQKSRFQKSSRSRSSSSRRK